MNRRIHCWPFVKWWRGPDDGKKYTSIVVLILPGRTQAVGLWFLWAHDWRWTNIKTDSVLFRSFAIGPLLVKVARGKYPWIKA